jgi:hypothetical protein
VSNVRAATIQSGVVKVGSLPVADSVILSQGLGDSSGVLVIQGGLSYYIAKTSPDLDSTIQKSMDALEDLASVLNTIAMTLTSIGAGMTGPTTAPPPTLAVDVASIVSKATEITATRTALNTLKGALK